MQEYKILFTGPMGAGKTTAIASLSDVPPIITDVTNTDSHSAKTHTTVGLDYGQATLESGARLRLFGTPGQKRFDFLWRTLIKNSQGMVILIKHNAVDPLADLAIYLEAFAHDLNEIACVIGLGHIESNPTTIDAILENYSSFVAKRGLLIPVVPIDVRQKSDVRLLIDILFVQMEMSLCATTYLPH